VQAEPLDADEVRARVEQKPDLTRRVRDPAAARNADLCARDRLPIMDDAHDDGDRRLTGRVRPREERKSSG
jgi:hypothetical protein